MSERLKAVEPPTAAELTGKDLTGEVERIDAGDSEILSRVMLKQQQAAQLREAAIRADVEAKAVTDFFAEGARAKYNLMPNDDIAPDGKIIRKPYAEAVQPKAG